MTHSVPPPIAPIAPVNVPTNHLLHFLMGLMTCGGWWLAWPFIHLGNVRANAARWRQYQRSVATYQQALWARENMPGEPVRPRWEPGQQPVWHDSQPAWTGYGDPMAGYRPAAEQPLMQQGPTHQDYQEMARQRKAAAEQRLSPARVDQPSPAPPASPPDSSGLL